MEIQQNHSPDSDDGWGDEDKISQTSSKPLTGKLLPRIEMFPFTGAFKPSPGSSAKSNPFFKNLPSPKNGDYQGPPTIQLTGLEKSFSRMTLFSPPPGEVRILDVTTPDAVSTAVSTVTSPVGSMSFSPPPVGDVEIVAAPSPVSVAPSAAKIETKPVVPIPISTPPREGKVPVVATPEHVPSVEPTLPSPQKEVVKIAIATTPEPILASSAAKVTPSVASPFPSPQPRDVKMANVTTPEPAPSAVAKVFSPVASPVFSPQPVITPEPRPVTPAPTATIATPVVPSRAVEETRKDYYVTPVKGRPQKHFTWKDAKYSTNLKDAAFVEVSFIWNIETYQIIADEDRQPLFESHAKIVKLLENGEYESCTKYLYPKFCLLISRQTDPTHSASAGGRHGDFGEWSQSKGPECGKSCGDKPRRSVGH